MLLVPQQTLQQLMTSRDALRCPYGKLVLNFEKENRNSFLPQRRAVKKISVVLCSYLADPPGEGGVPRTSTRLFSAMD